MVLVMPGVETRIVTHQGQLTATTRPQQRTIAGYHCTLGHEEPETPRAVRYDSANLSLRLANL